MSGSQTQNTCKATEPFHWANAIKNGVKMYYIYMIHPLRLYALCECVIFSILLGIISSSHCYCPCLVPLYILKAETNWMIVISQVCGDVSSASAQVVQFIPAVSGQ